MKYLWENAKLYQNVIQEVHRVQYSTIHCTNRGKSERIEKNTLFKLTTFSNGNSHLHKQCTIGKPLTLHTISCSQFRKQIFQIYFSLHPPDFRTIKKNLYIFCLPLLHT